MPTVPTSKYSSLVPRAGASSDSSNRTPEWDGNTPRQAKVALDTNHHDTSLPAMITLIPLDGKGTLRDENGIQSTHDVFGARTFDDRPISVQGEILEDAQKEARQRAQTTGETESGTESKAKLIGMDDQVTLFYKNYRLIGLQKNF